MENAVNHEASHIRLEHAKLKFEEHYKNRSRAIRSLAFHGGLRIIYLIVGTLGLIGSLIYIAMIATAMLGKESFINYAESEYHTRDMARFAADKLLPTHLGLSVTLFALSTCFLIMARLCRKIVKRNMYIMDLENTYLEMKGE